MGQYIRKLPGYHSEGFVTKGLLRVRERAFWVERVIQAKALKRECALWILKTKRRPVDLVSKKGMFLRRIQGRRRSRIV